ncbi:unnamed protein product [Caenorhabditis auriculariae]|uniref:Uncharacterized protein n=1 Tax=Caenorhabditis auriculariae TaxID=2777116 RepID=A0A8S1HG01_9PELO|nr:unnamed protein product [Caenorhabditis auriculariae]
MTEDPEGLPAKSVLCGWGGHTSPDPFFARFYHTATGTDSAERGQTVGAASSTITYYYNCYHPPGDWREDTTNHGAGGDGLLRRCCDASNRPVGMMSLSANQRTQNIFPTARNPDESSPCLKML